MTPVFLDTVGLIATWDASDQWHAAARQAFTELSSLRRPVVTSTFVLLECGNAAARRPYRVAVARFRQEMELRGRLLTPTDEDCRLAWEAYARGNPDDAGIVDHVTFAIMRRLGITDVFSNHRHFKSAGFTTLF